MKFVKLLESIPNWLAFALLVGGGLAGIAIGLSDVFGFEHHLTDKKAIFIVLSLVGIVALSLGIERVAYFYKLSSHLDRVERLLSSQSGGRVLTGRNEIYSTATQSLAHARNSIRAVVSGKIPKAPAAFGEAVARRVREAKESGNPLYFEVVFAVDFANLPEKFREGVAKGLAVFERHGVAEFIRLRILNTNHHITFDVLLVDEDHAILSYPLIGGLSDVQAGIFFENQPVLCKDLSRWFEQRVRDASIDYRTWARVSPRLEAERMPPQS